MPTGIDPTVDYVFKRVFASAGHEPLLADLLNAALSFPAGKVVRELRLSNPFSDVDFAEEKVSILDIRAEDQARRRFNVEMERDPLWFFGKRALYYWADVYGSQLREGEHHATLQPTYSVCFLNGSLFADKHYRHRFRLLDEEKGVPLCKDLEIHVVELNKFPLAADEINTALERWCYFLKHGESLDREALPASLDAPLIRQALEVLYMLNQDEIERERYKERIRARQNELTLRYAAEHGREMGREERIEEVLEEAEEKVRKSLASQVTFAQRVLKQPVTPREDLLRLSVEDLEALALRLEQQALSGHNGAAP